MNEATYCPEDNKLRLYIGRVPRDEYLKLRAEGWTATPKQTCNFVATWTPVREDTALEYSDGIIDDEDQSPQDRAADRAERFGGYLDKRREEAGIKADSYDAGPQLHGYQSQALAERRANQHNRLATRAVNLWDKAEYWQHRTAGVISHALHVSTPGVRMGRIKELEADIRKREKEHAEQVKIYGLWQKVLTLEGEHAHKLAYALVNTFSSGYNYKHPRQADKSETSLYSLMTFEQDPITAQEAATLWFACHNDPATSQDRWLNHYRLRLAYENQMLEAQGGRAAFVEMEPGGFIGNRQVLKVNKSPATGRVVSVQVMGEARHFWRDTNYKQEETRPCLLTLNIERLKSDVYRPPTDEERAAFYQGKKEAKEERGIIPTINPTKEEAEKLQTQMNAEAAIMDKGKNYPRKPGKVEETTQREYSGSYKDYRAMNEYRGIKIRTRVHGWSSAESVVVITDKPQKAFPAGVLDVATEPKQLELMA